MVRYYWQAMEFAPLEIPKNSVEEDLSLVYKIYSDDGEFVSITANSAAEAIEISQIKNPTKIINAAIERAKMLEAGVLHPLDGEKLQTRVTDVEGGVQRKFGFLFLEHVEDSAELEQGFMEMDIKTFADTQHQYLKDEQ